MEPNMLRTILKSLWSRKRRLVGTSIAVILGVAFLAGTMIIGSTTEAGFRDTFTAANDGTDVVVRDATRIGSEESRMRGLIDEATVERVAAVDGVASAVAEVRGTAQLVGADGQPVGGGGPPTIAANWVEDPELSWLTLTAGRAPEADGEVVVDQATAEQAELSVGDETTVLTPEPVPVTVVGLAIYGDTEHVGGVTYVSFDTETAQQLFTGTDDSITGVLVRADEGVSAETLEARIAATLPDGVEAITGAELTAEQQRDVESDFLGFFKTLLLAFAGIAIVVAAFSIHNTFSILVAQRTRESALMRAVGASRRQVVLSVAAEALAIGVLATVIGFVTGIGIASALQSRMESGLDMPSADIVIDAGAIAASAIIGIGTTLVASVGPAIKASRVPPLAALRDVAVDRSGTSVLRAVVGALVAGAGAAALITATSTPEDALSRAGLGSLGLLVGAVVLGPVVARPAAAIIGAGPAAFRGVTGRLARRNAMRNPRRTAASASALMVGTAVVGLFTTFGASIKASIDEMVDEDFAGDLIVLPEGFSGSLLSPELAPAIAELPTIESAVGTAYGPAVIDGDTVEVAATDVTGLSAVFDVDVTSGSLSGFAATDVAISEDFADDRGLDVGSTVPMTWVDGATTDHTVSAVYHNRMTFGDVIVSGDTLAAHVAQDNVTVVLVDVAEGVDVDSAKAEVGAVTAGFAADDPMDRDEYTDTVGAEVDTMLYFVYGMLGVAVIIALMGIANTLSLSIHERRRELGLSRAVGQSRSQLRSTVRWESVIIAVFGTIGGISLGGFLGWGIVRALKAQEGFGVFALPVVPLAVILGLAAAAGVVAALRPARRAARTDILTAIASD
jgi:putative ABC transport system permease protein